MALRTELKQILRTLFRNKLLTSINLLGLGIGLGSVILLTTFLLHEFSFDQHFSKSSRIYRVVSNNSCGSYYAMGESLRESIPDIENICRITDVSDVWTVIMNHNDHNYPIYSFIAADPSILNMLDIEVDQRQTNKNLLTPKTILISDRIAKKYFGKESPVGESIEFNISKSNQLLQVAGVFKHLPSNSSFQADFICDISVAFGQFEDLEVTVGVRKEKRSFDFYRQWERHNNFTTFLLLHKNSNPIEVQKKCFSVCNGHLSGLKESEFILQPFQDMYLNSEGLSMIEPLKSSQFESLKIFLSIGILILLVACLNYILISSSEQRLSINDIACRKINGASGKQIIYKVMLKSFLLAFASLIPAFIFVRLSLPIFNSYFHKSLDLSVLFGWQYISALFLITAITAVLAGSYLSIVALKSNPIDLLQKRFVSKTGKWQLSNYLVMAQFFVFILLLSSMLIMRKQMDYSLKKDLGFESKNIIAIELGSKSLKTQYTSIINEIQQIPNVIACQPTTVCFPSSDNIFIYEYRDKEKNKGVEQEIIVLAPGNIEFFGINIIDGVTFTESNAKNRNNLIINKAASLKFGVKAGGQISGFNIIGVVEDFHLKSIHSPIKPIFIVPQTTNYPYLIVKTDGQNGELTSQINSILQSIEPGYYFEPEVLTDKLNEFYKKDKQQTKIISFFSFVAMTLSFMGLFGFVSLTLSKRIKEIGIRKINGAKISEILLMLNRDFVKWVAIAFAIATPIAYYAMSKWLENFAYKTELSWWIFALAGLLALGIALLTVSFQSWKAATKNPVQSLRYE